MKRILVTGATGFIGRHCLTHLAGRGFEVHGLARRVPEANTGTWHAINLMDDEAVRALLKDYHPTHLLHLAWDVRPGRFWTGQTNLDWVAASLRLFGAFADAGGVRFVGAGTCAEYDWSFDHADEISTPCRPTTLYGKAKLATSILIGEAARLRGISFAWGRVFNLFGPGEPPGRLFTDVIAALLQGRSIDTTDGTQVRDYMHVGDVAGALSALADTRVDGVVNIASGVSRPVRDILVQLSGSIGRPELIRYGARQLTPGDPACLTASVARLANEVGYRPVFSLDQGIAQSIQQFLAGDLTQRQI